MDLLIVEGVEANIVHYSERTHLTELDKEKGKYTMPNKVLQPTLTPLRKGG